MLGQIDFLEADQFAYRAETVTAIDNLNYFKTRKTDLRIFFGMSDGPPPIYSRINMFRFLADGWLDQNKRRFADTLLTSVALVDPHAHRAFPVQSDRQQEQLHSFISGWLGLAPWNIFHTAAVRPITTATIKFVQAEVWIDQSRIACALERYHLAHGQYPPTLGALVPACIDDLPHDVINGQPYHYRLNPNGTFLLYSVGWNQTDEGGRVIREKDSPNQPDSKLGDWVWPTLKETH
jgi:hypothetical protein